ncbi:MAG: penicillin-binding protein 1C [Candidatus Hydrogenedentota bacterium]
MKKRWIIISAMAIAVLATGLVVIGSVVVRASRVPLDPAPYLAVEASPELLDRHGRLLFAYLNPDQQWAFFRPLPEISEHLIHATLAAEDQRFYDHGGVDPVAIARAAWQNASHATVKSGASTITMQLVKLHDPHDGTLAGKVSQAIDAMRIERATTKEAILNAYLNKAPYGMNLVGCEAASRRYFGKPARELTLPEAALLAGIPKSPTGYMPLKHPERAKNRRDFVLNRMHAEGYIAADECASAMNAPLGVKRHEFPQLAPHLAMQWLRRMRPGERRQTTLDATVQSTVDRLAKEAVRIHGKAITNAAIMVLDTETAQVLARTGSVDFFDTPGGGQVDSTRAARSPGSALKPFTYALALENNLLYASEMMLDDSLDYGLYSPVNFDGEYRGLISATYALQRSLNVPAVQVLERLGVETLYDFYKSLGLTTLGEKPDYYGMGLTLGNCDVRMDEVAAAYCALANLGRYRPLQQFEASGQHASRQVLSESTCQKIYEMMEQPFPGEFHRDVVKARGVLTPVAWKTGTSTGLHDAWTFAFNRHYVVAVWLGNNDGRASAQLVGAHAALPLARKVFRALPRKTSPAWPNPKDRLRQVSVCALSGLPASDFCPATREESFPITQYLHRKCDVHYPGTNGQTVERWPGSTKAWDLAKVSAPLPSKAADHAGAARVDALSIRQPADTAEYVLTREAKADTIRLRTSLDAKSVVHWYLNKAYYGESTPGSPLLLSLEPGEHTLTAMTPAGDTDTVHYVVEEPYTPAKFGP